MQFSNTQLQKHYERVLTVMTDLPEELRPICALMDAYDCFRITDDEDGPIVREILCKLTSTDLRPALRRWYRESVEKMNPEAIEFRKKLILLIGENL